MIRLIDCEACRSSGAMDCPACHGEGVDEKGRRCTGCDGLGCVACDVCGGRGVIETEVDDLDARMGW